jgi:predicted mannosyl-3-phosphoglycerate phosphatase (HAD superfamily)
MSIYKNREFKQFIKSISESSMAHWQDIATALDVDADTITRWKGTPEAQAAIQKGIDYAIEQMTLAGKKDWRMWEAKLKMLGVNPPQKVEAKVTDPTGEILKKFGLGGEDAGQTKGTTESSS